MSEEKNNVNRQTSKGRISSLVIDENSFASSSMNSSVSSFHSYVEDVPFELNRKYRPIYLSNIDIAEFDGRTINEILSRKFDFQLENQVLLEALEDVKRKKKEIEIDVNQQSTSKTQTNIQQSNEAKSLVKHVQLDNKTMGSPSIPISNLSLSSSTNRLLNPSMINPSTGIQAISPSNSYRLPSVRDIYWPTINQDQYSIPTNSTLNPISSPLNQFVYPINSPSQMPIPQAAATINPVLSANTFANSSTTINPMKPTITSTNSASSFFQDDLTIDFDGALTRDDPFHEAELRSLNDVAELNHLYSTINSGNTIRR